MPLTEDGMISREPDGSFNEEYCTWCYADGTDTYSDLDDLIAVCVGHMVGENFTDYLNRKKITWAKDALRNTDTNINLIALDLGFQDNSYFVKVFKKYVGITPTQYRQNMKSE